MTQPAVFTETWANPPDPAATVTAGGTTAPAAGTPETWTMAGGYLAFGQANPALPYPSLFRVYDRAEPGEAIRVTGTAGAAWQVIRGDQGTPPVAHAPGFAVHSLLSPAGLGALACGVPSGNGLVIPGAGQAALSNWADQAVVHRVAELLVPANEAVAGSVYEAVAWGWHHTGNATGRTFRIGINWGAQGVGSYTSARPAIPATQLARWKAHAVLSVLGAVAVANTTVWIAPANSVDLAAEPLARYQCGPTTGGNAITTTAGTVFNMTATGSPVEGPPFGNGIVSVWLAGSKAWRSA